MGEPLFDGVSIAAVSSGVVAILLLRSAYSETTNSARLRRLSAFGHLCLGIAVSLLLYRWIDGVMSLDDESRPGVWRSGALTVACGIGLVAAVKALIGRMAIHRLRNFGIATVSASAALTTAAAWEWALLILALLATGIAYAIWRSKRIANEVALHHETQDQPREPALVLFSSAALLLLLLGTWQHVLEYETQRETRSARYSAWPRATALKDAWKRTGWITQPGNAESVNQATNVASHEQFVALGLGAMWLVVVAAAWCHPKSCVTDSEFDHAN